MTQRELVAVVVATYNERENLTLLLDGLRQELAARTLAILVVDDASPDGTGDLADELATRDPRIRVLHRSGKQGLGSALVAGISEARRLGATAIVTMDADLSHAPEAVPQLLAALAGGADVAVGSRYVPGGSIEHWSLVRRIASRSANVLARWMTGSRAHDNTGNFRAFRPQVFERLDLAQLRSGGYTFFIETLWLLQRLGFRVVEVPIRFVDRRAGASKIPRSYMLQAFGLLVRLGMRRITERPRA